MFTLKTGVNKPGQAVVLVRLLKLTMYMGDPQRVAAMTPSCRKRANPKSAILSLMSCGAGFRPRPSCANRMFCGFRSRWTIPLLFIATIAPAKQGKCFQKLFLLRSSLKVTGGNLSQNLSESLKQIMKKIIKTMNGNNI